MTILLPSLPPSLPVVVPFTMVWSPGNKAPPPLYRSKRAEEQMKAGWKNLRRACDEGSTVTLAEVESILQFLTLCGSNVIEVRCLLMLP